MHNLKFPNSHLKNKNLKNQVTLNLIKYFIQTNISILLLFQHVTNIKIMNEMSYLLFSVLNFWNPTRLLYLEYISIQACHIASAGQTHA